MPTKHVFFRDPTGKPAMREDGKFAPTQMLAEVGTTSVLKEDGRIVWKDLWSPRSPLLNAFVVLDREGVELNHEDAKEIVWNAIKSVAQKMPGQPLAPKAVLTAADALSAAYFRQEPKPYVLVTSLSVKALPAKKIGIQGCAILPIGRSRRRYPLPSVLQSPQHGTHFGTHLTDTQYQWVKVSCSGRTSHDGVKNALDSLSLLRALWSFAATFRHIKMRFGSGPRKPIGVIHVGPVHTLHNPDGTAVNEEFFWFDPDFTGDQVLFQNDEKWAAIEKSRRVSMRRLASIPYRRDLEEILLRYVAALDQLNPDVAFLQLWGILEKITNTVGSKYDETIDRTCRIFVKSQRQIAKETLWSFRHHRNRYVHAGSSGHGSEEMTYLIKSFVDPHIARLLSNTFRVESLQDYGDFLGYPTDIATLERMRTWSTRALRTARQSP